eukprot:gene246-326_t
MQPNVNCLQSNRLIKIRFPSHLTHHHWTIEEKHRKKIYVVPIEGIMMSLLCFFSLTKEQLFEKMRCYYPASSTEQLEVILNYLLLQGIILDNTISNDDCIQIHDEKILHSWSLAGWAMAAQYHFFTQDAPYLDYSDQGKGIEKVNQKMHAYHQLEPDNIFYIPMDLLQKIEWLLAIAFGKSSEVSCNWTPVPLMRRTTPSGGSRHPTEGYFVSYQVPGLSTGWYHVQAIPCQLVQIHQSIEEDPPILYERQESCIGRIILTSNFKRTMYRYRDPRAFRVPHMDVGHLLTTIEILADELGITTTYHLNFNERSILNKIGASYLDEGVMAVFNFLTFNLLNDLRPIQVTDPIGGTEQTYDLASVCEHLANYHHQPCTIADSKSSLSEQIKYWWDRKWYVALDYYLCSPNEYRGISHQLATEQKDSFKQQATDILLTRSSMERRFTLMEALLRRRTCRNFAQQPVSWEVCSDILRALSGTFFSKIWKYYVVALNIDTLAAGVYLYQPLSASLSPIRQGDFREVLVEALCGFYPPKTAAFTLILAIDIAQAQAALPYERALREIYIDAGRLSQKVLVRAMQHHIGGVPIAMRDQLMCQLLSINASEVLPIQSLTLGMITADDEQEMPKKAKG